VEKSRDRIVEIVHRAVEDVNRDFDLNGESKLDTKAGAILYGQGSKIDSMVLVSLIVGIEENIRCEFGLSVTLANEKAMSAERSPFRTLDSMIDYVVDTVAQAT
jgi:acyl carrier protein